MKNIKYILSAVCLAFTISSCSEDEESVAATSLENLNLIGHPGSIELTWTYPDVENANRFVEIRYYDPAKQKEVLKTVSGAVTSYTVEDTRKKYGEYKFRLQPFSTTFTSGATMEIAGESEAAPITETYSSREIIPAHNQIALYGQKPNGDMVETPAADGTKVENLLDNNPATFLNPTYSASQAPAGTVYWLDVSYDSPQEYLKFSYITRDNASASFPAEIECYVKANEEDEWELVTTLTREADDLPATKLTSFVSKEYKASSEFKYFRFKVTKTHTGKVNFSLAEFRIFDVEYFYYNPEEE